MNLLNWTKRLIKPIHNMHNQIKESDWKVFKKLYPLVLERFYDRVMNELQKIVNEGEISSEDRYHQIYKTVQNRDKKLAKLFDNAYRRSVAFIQLVSYYREGLVTKEELNQLSEETGTEFYPLLKMNKLTIRKTSLI